MFLPIIILFMTIPCLLHSTMSKVHLTQDGGYEGIVVRIDTGVNEEMCQEVLDGVKVRYGHIW